MTATKNETQQPSSVAEPTGAAAQSLPRVASSGSLQDTGSLSDPENGERSAREKLKQTDLEDANMAKAEHKDDVRQSMETDHGEAPNGLKSQKEAAAGPLRRKRSAEDDGEGDEKSDTQRHIRKKSKDLTGSPRAVPEVSPPAQSGDGAESGKNGTRPATPSGEPMLEDDSSITSPKNKRLHADAFNKQPDTTLASAEIPLKPADSEVTPSAESVEPQAKRTKDLPQSASATEQTKGRSASSATPSAPIPPGSGFANVSSSSPFGSIGGKSVFGGAPKSTFGSLGGKAGSGSATTSVFGSKPAGTTSSGSVFGGKGSSGTTGSAFGGSLNSAQPVSGFGQLSGNTASPFGGFGGAGGSSASVFRPSAAKSPPPIVGLSSAPKSAFGAPAAEEDAEDEAGDDNEGTDDAGQATLGEASDLRDDRFYTQSLETGEEGETTRFHCKVKMFHWLKQADGKAEWKERAKGILKFNVSTAVPSGGLPSDPEASAGAADTSAETKQRKLTARFILRAEGSHRVLLNTPITKDMKVGDPQGAKPAGGHSKSIFFSGTLDGKLELLQFRLREENATGMYEAVQAAQQEM